MSTPRLIFGVPGAATFPGARFRRAIASPTSLTPIQVPPLCGSHGQRARRDPAGRMQGGSARARARASSRLHASRNPRIVGTTETVHMVSCAPALTVRNRSAQGS